MTIPQGIQLSMMDSHPSRDPVLAKLGMFFPASALPRELLERPASPRGTSRAPRRLRRNVFATPEIIALTAATVLVVCTVVGCALGSAVIAMAGLAATLLLGVRCHFALKRSRLMSISL
jgi:hypothetical protein